MSQRTLSGSFIVAGRILLLAWLSLAGVALAEQIQHVAETMEHESQTCEHALSLLEQALQPSGTKPSPASEISGLLLAEPDPVVCINRRPTANWFLANLSVHLSPPRLHQRIGVYRI